MNWFNTIFDGFVGALIGAVVTIVLYFLSKEKPSGQAYKILRELGKSLQKPKGEYYFTRTSNDNKQVANTIFHRSNEKVIATSFNENPIKYGEGDLISFYKYGGSNIYRITSRDICPEKDEKIIRETMNKVLKGSNLIIIPSDVHITKIDGIFTRQQDDTFLTFIAFHNPLNSTKNCGVIFRDGIAKSFFEYYENLIELYDK